MPKTFKLEIRETMDMWGDTCGQEMKNVTGDPKVGNVRFAVYDLTECPEDATLTRALFSAYDYIAALKTGMRIAQAGYTDLEYETRGEEE